jgi:hypothetical protein
MSISPAGRSHWMAPARNVSRCYPRGSRASDCLTIGLRNRRSQVRILSGALVFRTVFRLVLRNPRCPRTPRGFGAGQRRHACRLARPSQSHHMGSRAKSRKAELSEQRPSQIAVASAQFGASRVTRRADPGRIASGYRAGAPGVGGPLDLFAARSRLVLSLGPTLMRERPGLCMDANQLAFPDPLCNPPHRKRAIYAIAIVLWHP